jgi:hypothetical protein
MPEGDGTTLLRDIRRDPELKFTQVVLMTGSSDLAAPSKGVRSFSNRLIENKRPLGITGSYVVFRFTLSFPLLGNA